MAIEKGGRFWLSSKCLHTEPVGPDDGYEVGCNAPCTHCGDPACVAMVEQGYHVCDVVGSSPRPMDEV